MRGEIREEIGQVLQKYDAVDIVLLNEAPPLLEREVIYDGQLIYSCDEAAQAHYQAGAVSRWLDYKWHYDRFAKKLYAK